MSSRKMIGLSFLLLLFVFASHTALAGKDAKRCPNGCPRWHVMPWSGGTYQTDDPAIWDNIYGYDVCDTYGESTNPASCTEPGSLVKSCMVCGYYSETEIPPIGHSFAVIAEQEPTCEEPGYITKQCTRHTSTPLPFDMGWSINGCAFEMTTEIPALGHDFQIGDKVSDATCTSAETYKLQCSRCDAENGTVSAGQPLGHDYQFGDKLSDADCVSAAVYQLKCSRCGDVNGTANDGKPLGHDFQMGDKVSDATCTSAEVYKLQCTRCGVVNGTVSGGQPLGHDFRIGDKVSDATCTSAEVYKLQCTRCGAENGTVSGGQPLGHDFRIGDKVSDATCTSAAVYKLQCTRCSAENGTVSAGQPLGHDYRAGDKVSEATCTSPAQFELVCDRCGHKNGTISVGDLGPHEFSPGKKLRDATCTSAAVHENKCVHCGLVDGEVSVGKPNGHTFGRGRLLEEEVRCLEPAPYEKICSVCKLVDSEILYGDPVPHRFDKTQVEFATCEEPNMYQMICDRCGKENGSRFPEGKPLGHFFGEITRVEPTCEKDGKEEADCLRCHKHINTRLPALGHDWVKFQGYKLCTRCHIVVHQTEENTTQSAAAPGESGANMSPAAPQGGAGTGDGSYEVYTSLDQVSMSYDFTASLMWQVCDNPETDIYSGMDIPDIDLIEWAVESGLYEPEEMEISPDTFMTCSRFLRAVYRLVNRDETGTVDLLAEPIEWEDADYWQWAVDEGFYEEIHEADYYEQPVTLEEVLNILEMIRTS